ELKMEQIIQSPAEHFSRIFSFLGLLDDGQNMSATRISRGALEAIIDHYSFVKQSGGRQPGQGDPKNHYRKGVPGDWKNHFGPGVSARPSRLPDVGPGAGHSSARPRGRVAHALDELYFQADWLPSEDGRRRLCPQARRGLDLAARAGWKVRVHQPGRVSAARCLSVLHLQRGARHF